MIKSFIPEALALENCLAKTAVPSLSDPYRGKVRDVYDLSDKFIGIVVSDRISAFDHIMNQPIPFKGQILNKLAAFGFDNVDDIIETHIEDVPHPNVTIARKCEPVPIEVVVRAHLTGHAWRHYNAGNRELCGVPLPDNMREHEPFEEPIITPATKAEEGHDEDISEREIMERNLISEEDWAFISDKALQIFERGQKLAHKNGLILVDTKYEFGYHNGNIVLIDEVHTTDSSRYFYKEGFEERLKQGKPQKQLSKEFLREWLMKQGFQGKDNQTLPDLPNEFRLDVYKRYKELYEKLTATEFVPTLLYRFDEQLADIFSTYR